MNECTQGGACEKEYQKLAGNGFVGDAGGEKERALLVEIEGFIVLEPR